MIVISLQGWVLCPSAKFKEITISASMSKGYEQEVRNNLAPPPLITKTCRFFKQYQRQMNAKIGGGQNEPTARGL